MSIDFIDFTALTYLYLIEYILKMPSFGQNLKQWRNYKSLSQTELSQRSLISRPNLVAIEQGRKDITLSTLFKLAQSLRLSPGQLLDHPPQEIKLNRHQINRIAQAILNGSPLRGNKERILAYSAAKNLTHLLSALGREPKKILASLKPHAGRIAKPGGSELDPILKRVKHLAPSFMKNDYSPSYPPLI